MRDMGGEIDVARGNYRAVSVCLALSCKGFTKHTDLESLADSIARRGTQSTLMKASVHYLR